MPRSLVRLTAIAVVATLVAASAPVVAEHREDDDDQPSLFVNLTSNELNRAVMALEFTSRVRTEKQIPVTVFLNVDGVRLVDTRLSQQTHAIGETPRQMLAAFMQVGGQVIICPMCTKHVGGMTSDDVMSGVVMGSSETTLPPLFADDATVLSY